MGEWVFAQPVAVLDSGEVAEPGFELGLQKRVVEQPQRAGVDVVHYALLHCQKERLAAVDKDLRNVLLHDDWTLDGVFGKLGQALGAVELAGNSFLRSSHFVGLDLVQAVLPSQIAAERNEVGEFVLEGCSAALLEVPGGHVGYHLQGALHVSPLQQPPHPAAVVPLSPHLLRHLLHQPGFQRHQLVLQGHVALLPMFCAMMSCSIVSYLASKFS